MPSTAKTLPGEEVGAKEQPGLGQAERQWGLKGPGVAGQEGAATEQKLLKPTCAKLPIVVITMIYR